MPRTCPSERQRPTHTLAIHIRNYNMNRGQQKQATPKPSQDLHLKIEEIKHLITSNLSQLTVCDNNYSVFLLNGQKINKNVHIYK